MVHKAQNMIQEDEHSGASLDDYILHDGLRLVRPYYFDFSCNIKSRMEGKTVLDIMCNEFPMRDREYYQLAYTLGRLRVDGGLGLDTPLKTSNCIRHLIHRHEPPVLAQPPEVLAVTDDVVAVYKPPTLPVHVTGQFRKNTVICVLRTLRPDLGPLHPVHRLDKPVSGLLLLARSPAAAARISADIQQRLVCKVYIARVLGAVSWQQHTVDAPLYYNTERRVAGVDAGQGKPSVTEFRLLYVEEDGLTSVVECRPLTGRSHQIRAHLAHAGHPIANDAPYGGPYPGPIVFAPREERTAAAAALRDNTPLSAAAADHNTPRSAAAPAHDDDGGGSDGQLTFGQHPAPTAVSPSTAPTTHPLPLNHSEGSALKSIRHDAEHDTHCVYCPWLVPFDWPVDLKPLWLHALSYSTPQWQFTCPPPAWAAQGAVREEVEAHERERRGGGGKRVRGEEDMAG